MMMSTFSGLTVPEGQKEERRIVNGEVVNFDYPGFVADYYRFRGVTDNHNALGSIFILLEDFSCIF